MLHIANELAGFSLVEADLLRRQAAAGVYKICPQLATAADPILFQNNNTLRV